MTKAGEPEEDERGDDAGVPLGDATPQHHLRTRTAYVYDAQWGSTLGTGWATAEDGGARWGSTLACGSSIIAARVAEKPSTTETTRAPTRPMKTRARGICIGLIEQAARMLIRTRGIDARRPRSSLKPSTKAHVAMCWVWPIGPSPNPSR